MATNTTISEIIDVLGKLQHNYTSLAQYWYDIFYNPEPMQVSIDYYDENNEKVVVTIDNLAQIRKDLGGLSGEGAPSNDMVASYGSLYHDTKNGELYKYTRDTSSSLDSGYWDKLVSSEVLDSIVIAGNDPLENNVTSKDGVLYLSKDTHRVYIGKNDTWIRIDASPSLANQQTFKVTSGDASIVTRGLMLETACEGKNFVSVYVDGVLLNPDKYNINSNGFKLQFVEPLISPEITRDSIEVIVKYFTSLSLYEDYWTEEETTLDDGTVIKHKKYKFTKDLFEQISNITSIMNSLGSRLDAADIQVESLENRVEEVSEQLEDAVNTAVGNVTEKVKVIETSVINEKNTVVSLHNSVKNWYEQVSSMRNEVSNTKLDIHDDVQWLRDVFSDEEGNIDLKKFVYIDDFTNAISTLREDVSSRLNSTTNALNLRAANMENSIHTNAQNIEALSTNITNVAGTIGAVSDEIKETEANIRKDCFSESNFPLGFYAPCKVGTTLTDFIHPFNSEGATKYRVDMELMRDCSYYIMDFTSDLQEAGADKFYKQFNIINEAFTERDLRSIDSSEINSTSTSPQYATPTTGMLEHLDLSDISLGSVIQDGDYILTAISYLGEPEEDEEGNVSITTRHDTTNYAIGVEFNIPEYTNYSFRITNVIEREIGADEIEDTYLLQIRVMIKNKSSYRPRIVWENSNISWLGSEEPDFDAGKSYLLEFISYDMGTTWFAHTLGICQPSINGDTIDRTYTITLDNYDADRDLGVACDVYYTKEDGKTYYAGNYIIDNGGVIRDVVLSFSKKELGDTYRNIRIHKATDALFVKHAVNSSYSSVVDNLPDETITIDLADSVEDIHSYNLKLFNEDLPSQSYTVTLSLTDDVRVEEIELQGMYANDGTINATISSSTLLSVFEGCDETVGTTPWKLTRAKVAHVETVIDPETEEAVDRESSVYVYVFNRALALDSTLNLYVEPQV